MLCIPDGLQMLVGPGYHRGDVLVSLDISQRNYMRSGVHTGRTCPSPWTIHL